MSNIYFYSPNTDLVIEQADNVGQWLLDRYPIGTVAPRGLKIYRDSVCEENDITHMWVANIDVMLQGDSDYIVIESTKGPLVAFVPYIIAAIVAIAATLLLAPNVSAASASNANNRASPNNNLQSRTNTSRPGERIADIRGRVRAYPDLLMDYKKFINGTEYEVQFLCLGNGEYALSDIRDGITPSINISGEQLDFYKNNTAPLFGTPYFNIGGNIDNDNFPIMVAKTSNETDGSEIRPPNYADISSAALTLYSTGQIDTILASDTGTSIDWSERAPVGSTVTLTQFYSFELISGGDYTRYDLSGKYTVVFAAEDILIVDNSSVSGWEFLSNTGQAAYLQAYQLASNPSIWQFAESEDNTLRTFSPGIDSSSAYQAGPYLITSANKVMINLYAQNGVYKTNGDVFPFSVNFEVTLSDPNNIELAVTHVMTVAGRFTEAVGTTGLFDNPFNGAVNVTVRRIDVTDKGFNGTVVDAVKWRDLYAVDDISPRGYGDLTLIHAVTKATPAALKQKQRKLNMLATRIYNNSASANFADVIMSMHTDPFFGRRTTSSIDVDALYAVQQQILDYFGDPRSIEVGYTFDDLSTTYEDALNIICNVVNVTPFQVGSVIYFWPELPQELSAMQFGHAFKVPGTDKRTRTFSPRKNFTGVQVKYYDHDEESFLFVSVGEETNLLKINLEACQSRYLALIRANREYNKLQYQRITHECTTLSIGLQAAPGMRVDMIDNTRVKQNEGVVTDVDGLTLYLSDPVTMIAGNTYSITFTGRLGTLENLPIVAGDDEFSVVLQSEPTEDVYTGWLRDRTSYIIRTDDARTKLAMLVQTMEPSGRDNNYTVGLTCINYDARYYQDDL